MSNIKICGILNVTPDSFYDGGEYLSVDEAVSRALCMLEEGADIIDIGGESTRPGYTKISPDEEIARVMPVAEALADRGITNLSIDTSKACVAEHILKKCPAMINDISFMRDENMIGLITQYNCEYVLTHNEDVSNVDDLIPYMLEKINVKIDKLLSQGVKKDRIIVDPGVGFGKSRVQNLEIIGRLQEFGQTGCRIYLGVSNKSVIGETLNLPKEDRNEGNLAVAAAGYYKGVSFLRVHNVKSHKRLIDMLDAIEKV